MAVYSFIFKNNHSLSLFHLHLHTQNKRGTTLGVSFYFAISPYFDKKLTDKTDISRFLNGVQLGFVCEFHSERTCQWKVLAGS